MHLKLFNRKIPFLLLLFIGPLVFSQNYVESFNVANKVEVSINASYTNIIFETWNKNKVEVEAYIEGENLSEKGKSELIKNWGLSITGNSNKVSISADAGNQSFEMANMPEISFIGPLIENIAMPIVQNIQVPPLPPDLMESLGNIQFDYQAYEKDKEGYIKRFEAQMDENFEKDFQKKMEAWGERISNSWNTKKADSIGNAYGKKMEKWGVEYGKKMEAWANELEKKYEDSNENYSKTVTKTPNGISVVIDKNTTISSGNAEKTIIIRVPKEAKINVNIRYGELKMADAINLRANLNYSPFTANSIDGGKTLISASYAPININTWKQGVLNIKYIDKCSIGTIQNISLQANSSDVEIGNITNQAFLSGSFGDLRIQKISEGFETLDIQLENTDANLKMPDGAFSFYFSGNKSTLKYPKSLQLKKSQTAGRILAKGFNQNNTSNKAVTINSNYSNVILQ